MGSRTIDVGCEKTKKFESSKYEWRTGRIYSRHRLNTFTVDIDTGQIGKVVVTCPYCGNRVTVKVVSLRTIMFEQERLAMARREQRYLVFTGSVSLILALIAFLFSWPPFFWLAPLILGVLLFYAAHVVKIPRGPEEIPEKIVISSGHTFAMGWSFWAGILRPGRRRNVNK